MKSSNKNKRSATPFDERSKARRRAVQGLYQWHMTGQAATEIVQQFLEEQDFRRVDTEYFRALLEGAAQRSQEIETELAQFMERSPESLDPMERTILRLGAFELRDRLETPLRVVIDEAVELAKTFGSDQTPPFVNAVLDKYAALAREPEHAALGRD